MLTFHLVAALFFFDVKSTSGARACDRDFFDDPPTLRFVPCVLRRVCDECHVILCACLVLVIGNLVSGALTITA
jgi:hypothetical protein